MLKITQSLYIGNKPVDFEKKDRIKFTCLYPQIKSPVEIKFQEDLNHPMLLQNFSENLPV